MKGVDMTESTESVTMRSESEILADAFAEASRPYGGWQDPHEDGTVTIDGTYRAADVLSALKRLQAEESAKAAEVQRREAWEEMMRLFERHAIDADRVIPDSISTEVSWRYMWRTPLEWPAGGTYESVAPRDPRDEMVAVCTTSEVSFRVVGEDSRGRRVMSSDSGVLTTELTVVDVSPWRPAR